MDRTIGYLREIFSLLHQEQDHHWNPQRRAWQQRESDTTVNASAQEVQKELTELGWWPISAEHLKELWSREENELHVDFGEERKYLYLPALQKDANFVPVLSLKANLDEQRQEFRLRVMLVCRGDEGNLCGIGFRLETSECDATVDDDGSGHHDFYHAQLIMGFEKGALRRPIETPKWLPCDQPSFPLLAKDPLTLTICLLLTLYGKKHFWAFYQRHRQSLSMFHETIETRMGSWIDWTRLG